MDDDSNNGSERKDSQSKVFNGAVGIEKPAIRDALVRTAVQFLQNSNTKSSPLNLKINFLQKKGLTGDEIRLAIQRSGINTEEFQQTREHVTIPIGNFHHQHQALAVLPPPQSRILWIRDLANTLLALGGVGYMIYWIYQKFIKVFLFGKKPLPKKTLEVQIVELDLAVDSVKTDMKSSFEKLNGDVERLANQRLDIVCLKSQNEIQELTAQISSLKGLLLSRKQFPAVPSSGVPAIPSWQLPSGNSGEDEMLKEDDIQSVASDNKSTNGGSDSSLEMIKE